MNGIYMAADRFRSAWRAYEAVATRERLVQIAGSGIGFGDAAISTSAGGISSRRVTSLETHAELRQKQRQKSRIGSNAPMAALALR